MPMAEEKHSNDKAAFISLADRQTVALRDGKIKQQRQPPFAICDSRLLRGRFNVLTAQRFNVAMAWPEVARQRKEFVVCEPLVCGPGVSVVRGSRWIRLTRWTSLQVHSAQTSRNRQTAARRYLGQVYRERAGSEGRPIKVCRRSQTGSSEPRPSPTV